MRRQDSFGHRRIRLRGAALTVSPAWIVLAIALAACGRGDRPAVADTSVAATSAATDSGIATEGEARGCPGYGLWQPCNVEDRLYRAGLVFERRDEPVRHDFMSVPGIVYEASRAEIQVFLYASGLERERDTGMLDTNTVAPRGRRIIWPQPATLVTSNNLAAIILSLNARQAERIALALGAGLPARPSR